MLLSTPEQIEKYQTSGLWGDMRVDQLFFGHVQERAEDLALIDDQGLHAVSGRRPQCLSFGRAWKRVLGLCSFLEGVGVKPDTVVAMMLPPSVDAAVITLAASRLGLIIAPLPLIAGEAEIREKLEQVGAKAIVCCARYEDQAVAERARNVAADMFSIRFVFSIGDGAPDGLVDLQEILDDEDSVDEEALTEDKAGGSADAVLAIHWSSSGSLPARPIGRSHNSLLCGARHVHEATGLALEDSILVTHHLSGLNGYVAGLIAALDKGSRIIFHHFVGLKLLANTLAEFGVQHIFVPGAQWPALHGKLPDEAREVLKSITLVWNRSHTHENGFTDNETAARLLDMTNLSELAIFSQIRRHPGEVGSIPLGDIHAKGNPEAAWMQTHLFGMEEAKSKGTQGVIGGELCILGSMVPHCAFPLAGAVEGEALRATPDGFIHTEIACHLVEEEHGDQRAMFRPLGDVADVLSIGGLTERGRDLDELYKSCAGILDAAAFLVPGAEGEPAQLMAAIVVDDENGAKESFLEALAGMKLSSTRMPRDVIFVDAIPRRTDGVVQRDSLLEAAEMSQVA